MIAEIVQTPLRVGLVPTFTIMREIDQSVRRNTISPGLKYAAVPVKWRKRAHSSPPSVRCGKLHGTSYCAHVSSTYNVSCEVSSRTASLYADLLIFFSAHPSLYEARSTRHFISQGSDQYAVDPEAIRAEVRVLYQNGPLELPARTHRLHHHQ